MPTSREFRTLVDQTLQIARLLLISYRESGSHATSHAEQQALDQVMAILQEAYVEVYRLLAPAHERRGGTRDVVNARDGASKLPTIAEAQNDTSASSRRPRP